jgi:hypothetical protein
LLCIAGCCGKLYLTKAEFCKIYDKIEKKELDIIFRVFDVDKSNVISVEQIISGYCKRMVALPVFVAASN